MPFIKADQQIEGHIGRTYYHCTYGPDGGNWAAEVEEVKSGETEISADEHAKILATNVQALAKAAQDDPSTSAEEKAATIAALADTALLEPSVAEALKG